MSQTLTVTLRASRVLALALTAMAGAAIASSWISLPRLAFLPAAAGIVFAWIWHLAPALLRGPRAVRGLELGATGGARWQDASGLWNEAEIRPGSYVSTWLIVVNLVGATGKSRAMVLLPDCAASEDLRALRVWLRWHRPRQ